MSSSERQHESARMVVALGSPDCFTGSPCELRKESAQG